MPDDSVDPQRCRTEFIGEVGVPPQRMTITREESELKQLAYERERATWLKLVGTKET